MFRPPRPAEQTHLICLSAKGVIVHVHVLAARYEMPVAERLIRVIHTKRLALASSCRVELGMSWLALDRYRYSFLSDFQVTGISHHQKGSESCWSLSTS